MNAVVEHTNGWVSFVERAMSNPDYSVDKLQTLLEMRRTEAREAARHDFNRAMAQVQSELQQVSKDKPNPAHRSKYATLAALLAEAQPVYTQHGFSLRFGTGQAVRPDWVRVTCEIAHLGGWSEQHYLDGPIDTSGNKTPIQTIGSTVTYLRRYLLMMLLNLVTADEVADDDGEASRRPAYREAAASMPRGERVADPTVYDAHGAQTQAHGTKPQRTDEQWRIWLAKLRDACAVLYHRQEVVEVGERASVGEAMATGPEWVRREISGILAENYKRFGEDPEGEEPAEMENASA